MLILVGKCKKQNESQFLIFFYSVRSIHFKITKKEEKQQTHATHASFEFIQTKKPHRIE